MNGPYRPGQTVWHRELGAGTVLKVWSGWFSCIVCFDVCPKPTMAECQNCGPQKIIADIPSALLCSSCLTRVSRLSMSICPSCQCPRLVSRVDGRHIYEVRFRTGTFDLQERLLKPRPPKHIHIFSAPPTEIYA